MASPPSATRRTAVVKDPNNVERDETVGRVSFPSSSSFVFVEEGLSLAV